MRLEGNHHSNIRMKKKKVAKISTCSIIMEAMITKTMNTWLKKMEQIEPLRMQVVRVR